MKKWQFLLVYFVFLSPACQEKEEDLRHFVGQKRDNPGSPPLNISRPELDEKWQKAQQSFQDILNKDYSLGTIRQPIPGGSLAVVIDGKLHFSAGFGQRSLEDERRVEPDTVMTVGSLSKMITALTALSMKDKGQLNLDQPINQYMKKRSFRFMRRMEDQEAADQITLNHSLFHTAGLPDELPSGIEEFGKSVCTTGPDAYESYFQRQKDSPLWALPGDVWNYSNANYFLAAAALEAAGQASFEELSTTYVLERAGMKTASWDAAQVEAADNFALGYDYWVPYGEKLGLSSFQPSSTPCRIFRPAAGLHASVIDFAALAESLLADKQNLLSEKTWKAFMTPQVKTFDEDYAYSYGNFIVEDYKGLKVVGHDGISWGYSTVFMMVPEKRFALVAFVQAGKTFSTDLWSYALQMVELFHNLPRGPRPAVKPVDHELQDVTGSFRGWTYDYENYSEANPSYAQLDVEISLDNGKLHWWDDWLGEAELKSLWWPKFRVAYPDASNNINVRFVRDASGQVNYIVSRDFVAKRMEEESE
ncbi:MAG: serine hydrolase domain-containing protein [Oligoflexus sp.]